MFNESFSNGNLFPHKLDPRGKILITLIYSILLTTFQTPLTLSLSLFFNVIIFACFRLDWSYLIKRLFAVNSFIVFLWITLPFSFQKNGDPLWWKIYFSEKGLWLAILITLKTNSLVILFISLVSSSRFASLGSALQALYLPQKLVILLLLTYRYLSVVITEFNRLYTAIKIRGFIPRTNLHTYQTYAYLLGMVFVRSMEKAHRIYEAMLCRGFCGKFYSLKKWEFSSKDWFFFTSMLVIGIALGSLEWFLV
jgi:cobalt/nickel transport system permease protein